MGNGVCISKLGIACGQSFQADTTHYNFCCCFFPSQDGLQSLSLVPTHISCHFIPYEFFLAGFFWPQSKHNVVLVVNQLSLFFQLLLEDFRTQWLALYGFIWLLDYLFTVLWCLAKTCKINLMVHYGLCLLHSEAEINDFSKLCVVFEADTLFYLQIVTTPYCYQTNNLKRQLGHNVRAGFVFLVGQ